MARPSQHFRGVRQQVGHRVQTFDYALGAAWKIQDYRLTAHRSGGARKICARKILPGDRADSFTQAGQKLLSSSASSLRSDVARTDAVPLDRLAAAINLGPH